MRKNTVKWIDSLKGLGIILVVLGHCLPTNTVITNFIYSFHIPLFFFISGYLYNTEKYSHNLPLFFKNKFRRLIIPYFAYAFFTYAIWLLVGRNFGVNKLLDVEPAKPLIGIFFGNGIDNYLVFNIALWFLPALFSTSLLYTIIDRYIPKHIPKLISLLLLGVLGFLDSKFSDFRLPWGINIAFVAVLFYGLGHICQTYLNRTLDIIKNKTVAFIIGIILVGIGFALNSINGGVSFNSHSYGNYPLFLLSALSSITGLLLITKKLLNFSELMFLGRTSIRIFALHILSFSVTSGILKFLFKIDFLKFKESNYGPVIYFVAAIGMLSIYSMVLDYVKKKVKERRQ
ncbi:MAG: hypothetical protein B6226_04480 [Candidatus Cloacimonetes bacterium 4572_65]|nr:MAG: hypothetical protein B6226_04480 [Candidatus Cloacimonetes bacterium 4572_65]